MAMLEEEPNWSSRTIVSWPCTLKRQLRGRRTFIYNMTKHYTNQTAANSTTIQQATLQGNFPVCYNI